MAVTEVLPGLYTSDHQVAEGKNAIILGERGALAVDVGTYPEEGQIMADFIRSQGYTPNRVILTHGHGDHVLGGAAFAGCLPPLFACAGRTPRRAGGTSAGAGALADGDVQR
jgi:glyoxylase-like metal-dependent hydrolase (beta-lactamase superfamily II)